MVMEILLTPRHTPESSVTKTSDGWRLDISTGLAHIYRLAQLDDYSSKPRNRMKHAPPLTFSLRARISSHSIHGTWGFGLWNDPLGFSPGFGGKPGQYPLLPQTAWFMHASPPNWLSLQDDTLSGSGRVIPANGFFAGTFFSPQIPSFLLLPAILALPLCAIRPISQSLRRMASCVLRQDAASINLDITQWHEYSIKWLSESCMFSVDGKELMHTPLSPRPPLGLVLWIDNQFAAWNPEGRIRYGTLENLAEWMEIENLKITP
jgi:hypothetical protein